jgi:raffinose/stachyose/melibiose transport system substrate-binding protein
MTRRRFTTLLAVTLLAGTFLYSVTRLLRSRAAAVVDPSIEVIRFAHWQLEPGVREAFDAIAADYMALHPKVRVEQMDIPGRAWPQWLRTQLVGGTAPDLIELASYNNPDDMLARYFTPITEQLEERNPYNADEPDLRDLSWRKSYTAELVPTSVELGHYYNANLLEYYGAPSTMVTIRVFYNRRLFKAALGHERAPQTFPEFIALCESLARYAHERNLPIAPLAGSSFNITKFTDGLFSATSQRTALELDYSHALDFTRQEALITYVRGRWSLTTPSVLAGLRTVESIGRHMSAGWVQLNREDSMLQFLQGRAAMIVTGTWDAGGILMQSGFPIGAFRVPTFRRDDPDFGRWTLGPLSEASTFAAVPFGLTRGSRHPERAIDFLRFLTSRKSNAKFSRISTWLPVIKGVPVPAVSEAFQPAKDGYIGGINIHYLGTAGNDVLVQHLHLLSGSGASVDNFIAQTRDIYDRTFHTELARLSRISHETLRQKDSVLAGLYQLDKPAGLARSKFDRLAANQLEIEAQRLQNLRTLEDYPGAK